ncbi:MAG: dihydrodipicolinate synthase family protein [Herpetosiphonaceae bacterium]|nr:dihydrodipicolinate synthase family protein [Herpetosiphonaceae bacterium]
MNVTWQGVMPAITTPFNRDGSVDYDFFAHHCTNLVEAGCTGLVPLGSLGESATLAFDEKVNLLETAIKAVGQRVPIIPGIAALSTTEALRLAKAAGDVGCSGLMALPPYVYSTDWREMKAHVAAVMAGTELPVMLYNNPIAYRTDFLPEQIAELAHEHENLLAVKESSADVRRITAIRALLSDRLHILVGVDDGLVEAVQAGATGWIAGLVNALPQESVDLFNLALAVYHGSGDDARLAELYHWFLPLLRLDTVPKFVQLIKLTQELVGLGSARVRPPRLELASSELEEARQIIQQALADRPS